MGKLFAAAGSEGFGEAAEMAVGELRGIGDDYGFEDDLGGALGELEGLVGKRMGAARMAGTTVKPPNSFEGMMGKPSVFLAGAIDMGGAEDWQAKVEKFLEDKDCVILNPRRDDWDSSWKQEIENEQFRGQVEWELEGLEEVDVVAMGLPAESKAPISLMELGLHAKGGNVVVWCPSGYWKKGNVDVVCARYGIEVFEDFEEFCSEIGERLRISKLAAIVARRV
jgi:hypothetical protein